MYSSKKHSIFFSILLTAFSTVALKAQPRFALLDTLVVLNKDISFGTLHDYAGISNPTNDTLQLRWIKRLDSRYPSQWITHFTDPTQYQVIDAIDSADFSFYPDGTTVNNKLIIGVEHNGRPAHSYIDFTVFEIGNRADSLRVRFDITVRALSTEESTSRKVTVFPSQSHTGRFTITNLSLKEANKLRLFDLTGQEVPFSISGQNNNLILQVDQPRQGLYLLRLPTANGFTQKLTIN